MTAWCSNAGSLERRMAMREWGLAALCWAAILLLLLLAQWKAQSLTEPCSVAWQWVGAGHPCGSTR